MLVSKELVSRDNGSGDFPVGCLSWRTSKVDRRTSFEPDEVNRIISSRLRTPLVEVRDR